MADDTHLRFGLVLAQADCSPADGMPTRVPRDGNAQDKRGCTRRWGDSGYENLHSQINMKAEREVSPPPTHPPSYCLPAPCLAERARGWEGLGEHRVCALPSAQPCRTPREFGLRELLWVPRPFLGAGAACVLARPRVLFLPSSGPHFHGVGGPGRVG